MKLSFILLTILAGTVALGTRPRRKIIRGARNIAATWAAP